MNDCAMVTVPCLVTVAAGVLAPGHLGELTGYLPFELADDVLEGTRTVQKRMRALPSRVGMYFVLAMTLFPGIGYLKVWDKMTGALEDLVGFQNSAIGPDLDFYAARSYSLTRPPRTGRRWIRFRERSATG